MMETSLSQSTASAMAMTTSGQSFLQLPYESRLDIYRKIGIISFMTIFELEWWVDKSGGLVPYCIPQELFYTSEEVSEDALSVFWSENVFNLNGADLYQLLDLATPHMWSSLRDLTVRLNRRGLRDWREVCRKLGAHVSPFQLTLRLNIYQDYSATDRQIIALTKSAFRSMLKLPMLKSVSFETNAHHGQSPGFYRKVTCLFNRLTCPPTVHAPFRFMDLPVEIQYMILEQADIVAPGPVIPSKPKGYVLEGDEYWHNDYCGARYDSSKICCWSLPANLFLVSRHISEISAKIFFSRNKFVVKIQTKLTGTDECLLRAPNDLIWSPWSPMSHDIDTGCEPGYPESKKPNWCPKNSAFLSAFPQACISRLRSVTWDLPMFQEEVVTTHRKSHKCGRLSLLDDWYHTIDFIGQTVRPLSNLTITLKMSDEWARAVSTLDARFVPLLPCSSVMYPLQKLRGLGFRNLVVSRGVLGGWKEGEELHLKRLAMDEGYNPTLEELEAWRPPQYDYGTSYDSEGSTSCYDI
jgi:hypothetical protein